MTPDPDLHTFIHAGGWEGRPWRAIGFGLLFSALLVLIGVGIWMVT